MDLTMSKELLIETCAKICYYAQEHSHDWDWPRDEIAFQHTSYVVACFLAKHLNDGVEWDVVFDDLMGDFKPLNRWEEIISDLVKIYA